MAILSTGQVHLVHHPKHILNENFSIPLHFRQQWKTARAVPVFILSRCSMQQLSYPLPTLDTKDVKVIIQKSSLIGPARETEKGTTFLSNIDQRLNFMSSTVQFFTANQNFPFETVISKLETGFSEILMHYDFLAGRLKWNIEECRLEIDCNSAGAGFIVASCELRLEEIGDLVSPKVGCQQLTVRKWDILRPEDQPLIVIQATSFKCGGFAIGLSINHIALDGIGTTIFLQNLSSVIAANLLVLTPCKNRRLLAARSPPHVTFPHPELINLESLRGHKPNSLPIIARYNRLQSDVFYLSANDIAKLKASNENSSSFNFVAAHIWRCVALARNSRNDPKKASTLLYPINIRPRIEPRLPISYSGNAILNAYSTTTCQELEEGPISHIAQLVSQAASRMTDEYIRSVIDWAELHKGFPNGELILNSLLKHGLNEVEYPWGKPKWTCPVVKNHGNPAIVLLPDTTGTANVGVNILVSLPHWEMEKFKSFFHKFLA